MQILGVWKLFNSIHERICIFKSAQMEYACLGVPGSCTSILVWYSCPSPILSSSSVSPSLHVFESWVHVKDFYWHSVQIHLNQSHQSESSRMQQGLLKIWGMEFENSTPWLSQLVSPLYVYWSCPSPKRMEYRTWIHPCVRKSQIWRLISCCW